MLSSRGKGEVMDRTKLLKILKKTGLAVSLIGVMVGATAMTGCKNADNEEENQPLQQTEEATLEDCFKSCEDKFIVIDGVLHYGDMYSFVSTHVWADTDKVYYKLADGASFLSNEHFKIFYNDEKPDNTFYDSECEECMKHVN